jgi:hypothetical protein
MQLKNKFVQETIPVGLNLGPRRKIGGKKFFNLEVEIERLNVT